MIRDNDLCRNLRISTDKLLKLIGAQKNELELSKFARYKKINIQKSVV